MTAASHNGASATSLATSGDASLEDLIEECTNRLQRGEVVDIKDLARDHPGHDAGAFTALDPVYA